MFKRVLIGIAGILFLAAVGIGLFLYSFTGSGDDPEFFESEIRAFEEADAEARPASGQIVFVGSSSIRMWSTLEEDMAPLPVLNRGFGGAHLSHVIHNAPRIVLAYKPAAVVVYAGDNDMASGKSIERVVSDYRKFVDQIHAALPQTRIYYLPIKPSKLRFELWPQMSEANRRIDAINAGDPRLATIDVASPLLNSEGVPRDDIFRFDGLHLSATGYEAWTSVVAPILTRDFAGAAHR